MRYDYKQNEADQSISSEGVWDNNRIWKECFCIYLFFLNNDRLNET